MATDSLLLHSSIAIINTNQPVGPHHSSSLQANRFREDCAVRKSLASSQKLSIAMVESIQISRMTTYDAEEILQHLGVNTSQHPPHYFPNGPLRNNRAALDLEMQWQDTEPHSRGLNIDHLNHLIHALHSGYDAGDKSSDVAIVDHRNSTLTTPLFTSRLPFQVRGTTDALIRRHRLFRLSTLSGTRIVCQLKRNIDLGLDYSTYIAQSVAELTAANFYRCSPS